MLYHHYKLLLLSAFGVCLLGLSTVSAQQVRPINQPDGLRADVDNSDVYLNDSFEASDVLFQVKGMVRRKRWSDAASLLQTASDRFGQKLIRIAPGHYVGLQEHINHLIANWPATGIAAYCNLFERDLQKALSSLTSRHDISSLLPLFDRYFCTSLAGELADTIGQLAIESGDLALAEHIYQRVLDRHPEADVHQEQYRARLMIIAEMKVHGSHISSKDHHIQIPWMGEQRKISEVVDQIRNSFQPVQITIRENDWPIFGGDDTRDRLATTRVDELGLLWHFYVNKKSNATSNEPDSESTLSEKNLTRNLIMHPMISNGVVFVQRLREIIALHLATGEVVWRFRSDHHRPDIDYLDDRPAGWDAVTIQDSRVYASLPGDAMPYYSYDSSRSPHELICLDAKNGKLIWRLSQHDFVDQFSEVHFDSSPVVRQGKLYIVGRRRRSFGFEDCYLFRINATTGKLETQTHLGSASTGSFGSHPTTKSSVALHGDTVYVCSNLGSVAAVSAHTGIVRWLRLYKRLRDGSGVASSRTSNDTQPWRFQPVMWTEDRVVLWPTDADNVFILSTEDGRLLKSIPTESIGGMEMLLGIHDNTLCGAGQNVACYDLDRNTLLWSAALPEQSKLFGLGSWVDHHLMISTTKGISTYQIADGQRTDIPWGSDLRGGNLLPMPEYILVADHQSISAFVRKSDIWKALREKMAASPADPLPALEMAEVALRSGEIKDALTALQEADRRASLNQRILQLPLQTRIFNDAINFADLLSERSTLEEDVLNKLFTLAAQYAPDTVTHLQYRLRFSTLFENSHKPGRALQLYQQILQDRTLRNLPIHQKSETAPRASVEAHGRIAVLIEKHGRVIYQPYETQAVQWLQSGREAQDIVTLANVVETYPNSLAAPRAMIAHGDLLIKRDQPVEAAILFAKAYHRYGKDVDRPVLLRKIADAYENAGKIKHAYRWLSKAASEHPSILFEHGDQLVSFLQYRERLAYVRNKIEPVRPDISLPLDHHYQKSFEQKVTLLKPKTIDNPISSWSKYYVYTKHTIIALNSKDGNEIWDQPVTMKDPVELLVATNDQVVFTTMHEVFALNPRNGVTLWTIGNALAKKDDDGMDWEMANIFKSHTLHGNHLINVRENGKVSCISIDNGQTLWSRTFTPAPASTIFVSEPWVVFYYIQNDKIVIARVDLATGTRFETVHTEIAQPVQSIFTSLDGQTIIITSRSITSFDAESKKQLWQTKINGNILQSSLVLDLDAVYFSQDLRELQKISMDDGHTIWQTEQLIQRGEDDLTVMRQGNYIITTTNTSVSALDPVTGLILWKGTTVQRPRLISRRITKSYVVAIDLNDAQQPIEGKALFYDHRNASGVIPKGGSTQLGSLENIQSIMVVDDAILIQTGNTIHGFAHR